MKNCNVNAASETNKQCFVGLDVTLWWIDVVPAQKGAVLAKRTLASHQHNKDGNKSSGSRRNSLVFSKHPARKLE